MLDQDKQKAVEMYWLNRLSGDLPKISLPTFAGIEGADMERNRLQFDIPLSIFKKLQIIGNFSDIAMFILFLTGLNIALYKYTGCEDILVGTISPRKEGSKDNLIFCRNRLLQDLTLKETINQIKDTVLKDFDYTDYSFGILYQKLLANRDIADLDIFNAAFIYDKFQGRSKLLNQFSMVLTLSEENDRPVLQVEYKSNLFPQETITHFCKNLLHLFDNIDAKLDTPILELEIVGVEEKKVLDKFNETQAEYPYTKTIQQLFEEQAEKSPTQIAVVFNDRHITYRELNMTANRLARYLRLEGVENGVIVALLLNRSLEVVIAMLAVLKAGGIYLPIDPTMPKNRIITMLKDSNAALLLTRNSIILKHSFTALQGLNEKKLAPFYSLPRQQILNLDELPIPDRSLVDLEKFNRFIGQVMVKDIISLQTARGCPYNCSYCSKIWHKKHVSRSAEHIFKELQMYYDMGVRRFSIFDDIFNVDIKNSIQFFEIIIKKGLNIQLFFPNGLRGDLLTKDYIDLLVEAGLVCTALALETASPRLQKLIKKNLKLDIFRENAEYFCNKYPQVVLELFTMHGFPTETEEEARETMNFIKSLKWVHFPYVFILKVYPDTDMADLAMEHGVLRQDILRSEDLAFHDLSPTSPFKKSFTKNYRAEFLNDYFLAKERLLHVLPYQLKVFTRDEIIQKYDSYLPTDIKSFSDLLRLADIKEEELPVTDFLADDHFLVPDLNRKIGEHFPVHEPARDALRVLFLDLTQYFTSDFEMLYDVVEPPLGGMYVMTYLKEKLAERVDIKILKSRIDFDSYDELRELLAEFKPQVIGVRSLTFYRDFFHRTIQVMRQWEIDVPIIAGGPYATRNYDSLLQDKNIDLLVKSEGETTFCEIIEKIIANGGRLPADEELKKIGGIGFIPKSGETTKKYARQILILDELADALSRENPVNLQPLYHSSDPAYIIFTSGSTGKPKGVLAEHRNVVNTLTWFAQRYNLQHDVHVLQLSNTTFDPSVEQIFATLLYGATLHLPEHKEIILDREGFRAFVQRHRINIVNFVPGTLKELLGSGERLPSLQEVIAGGEKLEQFVNNRIIENGYELHNHYGPTETTIDALAEKCSANEKVRLGRPIDNVCCYILGKNRELMPVGVPGELYIGGAGVTRGYLNNPELTVERFIISPMLSVIGYSELSPNDQCPMTNDRLYKTGDLAYWLPEGKIEFLGRIDEQVKIRGFRIELGEIETQLLQHKEVKDAVVTAHEAQKTGDKFLCAYYVAKESPTEPSDLDGVELRSYLSETLPDYMIPTYFIRLDNIPLNPNGKVDRSALPQPRGDDSLVDYEAPRDEVEETLADIWGEVLGRKKEEIGIDSNFFEIGGDSIKVIQISARLRKFGMRLESGDLFLSPTIRMLRSRIKNIERKIDQGTVTGEIKLSPIQAWFFSENILERHHYNMAVMLYSAAGFEEEIVRAVFTRIQEHHDALRMSFREENGRMIQTAHGLDYPLSLQVFDFSSISAEKQAAELLSAKANELQAGIDLENGPLMKLGLFHLADGDRLLVVIHHLVVDGISWRILFEDIETLYRQKEMGHPFALPPKTDSYRYWCERLWQYANSESFLTAERDSWMQIETEKVDEITADFPAPNLRANTHRLHIELNEEQTELLLTEVNRAFGTEINDILLTALALGVQETFGIKRVLVALEGHGRQSPFKDIDISRTVGWFTSIYPVILEVASTDGMTTEENLARQIKKVKENLHRLPNRGIGYGILKYLTSPEYKKGVDFKLRPRIGFNYLGQFDADVENRSFGIAQESVGRIQSPEGEREFELDISGMIADKKLRISVSYSPGRFKNQTVETLLDHFKTILVSIITFCVSRQEKELTPSDLDFKDLSIEELDTIFD